MRNTEILPGYIDVTSTEDAAKGEQAYMDIGGRRPDIIIRREDIVHHCPCCGSAVPFPLSLSEHCGCRND